MLTGEKDPQKIMAGVLAKYPMSRLILTLGSDGAWYADEDGRCYQGNLQGKGSRYDCSRRYVFRLFSRIGSWWKDTGTGAEDGDRRIRDCCIEKGSSAVDPDGRRSCTEVRGDGIAVISGACLCSAL